MNELLLYGLSKLTVIVFGLPLAFVGPVREVDAESPFGTGDEPPAAETPARP